MNIRIIDGKRVSDADWAKAMREIEAECEALERRELSERKDWPFDGSEEPAFLKDQIGPIS